MRNNSLLYKSLGFLLCISLLVPSCVSRKKKGEVSKLGKFYHNVTSEYNGYFNANELYHTSLQTLKDNNNDNYTKLLEVYDYVAVNDPKIVNPDLDKAIEKVTRVAAIHEPGDWVDNCYVLMGKSQYLKQDYAKSTETFEFFENEFNPINPYGKGFRKKKLSSKQKQKLLAEERKVKQEEKEKAREVAKEKREEEKKIKEEEKKELQKQREAEKKQREAEKKQREKDRKKKKSSGKREPRSKREVKKDTTATNGSGVDYNKLSTNKSTSETNPSDTRNETPEVEENQPISKTKPKEEAKEDETSYTEGLIWLAKSYIRMENYSAAEFLLRRIEKDHPKLSDEEQDEFFPAYADLYLKQKEYTSALTYLDEAIDKSGSKNDKARYAFIAGQIHQMQGSPSSAIKYFKTAKSKAKDFKLEFMSELALARNEISSGDKGYEKIVSRLEGMLKETKYEDFKDQIYFALGDVALNYDVKKAKEYFQLSSKNNKGDVALKTEAAYKLAKLFFNEKQYKEAKLYYDTTLASISTFDDRYVEVKTLSSNLTSIANNIQTVERVDSLLAMGEMSDDELKKIAKKRLQREQESGVKTQENTPKTGLINTNKQPQSSNVGFSNFFAYNKSGVESGKKAFQQKWGQRKLEDNWRRSSKVNSVNEENNADTNNNANASNNADIEITDSDFKRVLSDVPFTSYQKEQYRTELKTALLNLGRDYRNKLEEYKLSNDALESYLTKFPDTAEEPEVYYYLFSNYTNLNDIANAEKYKNLLKAKHPESKFGKMANDPAYLAALSKDVNKLDVFYTQSYDLFQKKDYDKVITRMQTAMDAFGKDNKLMAKFTLLNAMCLGATKGKEVYVNALKEVVARYPRTPEETRAKEILRFLAGDNTSFDFVDMKEVDDIFEIADDERHYVMVIILTKDGEAFEKAKIAVSDYNKQYYSQEALQIGESVLSKTEQTQLILVRSFPDKKAAMKYYDGVMKSKDQFISPDICNFELLPATQSNYRKTIQDQSHKKYRAFFEKNYLGK